MTAFVHRQYVTRADPPPGVGLGGRYVLDRILGAGGTADVYAGRDRLLARPVAVKWLRSDAEPAALERLGAEAALLAGLDHPGLVRFYDSGTEDGRPYLVMEQVGPASLRSVMAAGPMAPESVACIGRQVADALAYLHGRGLVHRDLTPGNVLVEGSRWHPARVWLADLGIARSHGAAHLTATGMTVGTPAFLSPEQVRGGTVTPASDVWSLGLVLLECLTGHREYEGPAAESAVARLTRPPVVPYDLPRPWATVLQAMLAPEADLRPAARELPALFAALAGPAAVGVEPRDAGDVIEGSTWRDRAAGVRWLHVEMALAMTAFVLLVLGLAIVRWDQAGFDSRGVGGASGHPVQVASTPASAGARTVKAQAVAQPLATRAQTAVDGTAGQPAARGHGKGKAHGHGKGQGHGPPDGDD
jgi:hypothetical protein